MELLLHSICFATTVAFVCTKCVFPKGREINSGYRDMSVYRFDLGLQFSRALRILNAKISGRVFKRKITRVNADGLGVEQWRGSAIIVVYGQSTIQFEHKVVSRVRVEDCSKSYEI